MIVNNKAKNVVIDSGNSGQRLDNFLMSKIKNIPKSHVYKLIRTGQVRINSSRSRPSTKLKEDDIIRIPPYKATEELKPDISKNIIKKTEEKIIYEDNNIIIFNKPASFAVHSGTNIGYGLIDLIRIARKECERIDLLHRLDKDTSGCIIFTKNLNTLRGLQKKIINNEIEKKYICLVDGIWDKNQKKIEMKLLRKGKEKKSISKIKILKHYKYTTLLEVEILTGRYHQIRKQCSSLNHSIICDNKYGNKEINKIYKEKGLNRIFLHSCSIKFNYKREIEIKLPIAEDLKIFLANHK
tara:strand:+ start:3350 stop:4240 length:891 start_codon:yes stop_codon:yes gene_type:complete